MQVEQSLVQFCLQDSKPCVQIVLQELLPCVLDIILSFMVQPETPSKIIQHNIENNEFIFFIPNLTILIVNPYASCLIKQWEWGTLKQLSKRKL